MIVIELVGMVGSGKSTIARELPELLAKRGVTAYGGQQAIEICLDRSWFSPLTHRLLSDAHRMRLNRAVYRWLIRPVWVLLFVLIHTRAVRRAFRASGSHSIPRWHRRKLRQLFLHTAAAASFVRPRLRKEEAMILEEGIVHRAVNLFAWGEIDHERIEAFLSDLPPTDLLVSVDAPLPVCLDRVAARGLPRRLEHQDGETIERFFDRAAAIIEIVEDWLGRSSIPTITVFNGASLEQALADLSEGLDLHALSAT